MIHRIEIGLAPGQRDPRGEHLAAQAEEFLGVSIDTIRTRDVYLVEAPLSPAEVEQVVGELTDPVLQRAAVGRLEDGGFDVAVSVGYRPGVADPIGKSARVAIQDTLGRKLEPGSAVFTSTLYLITGTSAQDAQRVAYELLANPVIQTVSVETHAEWQASPPSVEVPRVSAGPVPAVRAIELSGNDRELERISRNGLLALSLEEMRAIRDHFAGAAGDPERHRAGLGPSPTDVELECLAQTWSEHCKHKIFNATIEYFDDESGEPEIVESLFDTYIRGLTEAIDRQLAETADGSWLVSVFHDNAGVVTFDDEIHLVYKVETHNSPSALDPYGGAITGIVGVNRDPFGTGLGADLLVNVWGYCFASPHYAGKVPQGLLHPRRIRDGVHRGVIDGGNQSGIPYGRGWELFDDRYLGKPLVFCGTVGALPIEIAGGPGEEKRARPGDAVVMVGGRIGADGIHGATFSSAALDEASPAQAVQIGDPLTQKMMFDFLLEARDRGLYSSITDNGAGGLSSSVGEMARATGGAQIDLARAPLKYAGLAPWEIFLSEAQERMTLAVPQDRVGALLELASRREVEATVLGEFSDDGFLRVDYDRQPVALLSMSFLHDGAPDLKLTARWAPPRFATPTEPPERPDDPATSWLDLTGRPNLASNEAKARHYDHEVKGLAVVRPFVGVHADVPAEATVFLARHGSLRGLVLSEGVNPYLSDLDPRTMAASVVDEAVRRQLAAGARLDRIAALDNFCWPDPVRSESTPDGEYKLAQLVRACRGLYDTCRAYGVPLVSGKDSMKNEAQMGGVKICVPPTLLVSAIGQIDDVRESVTVDFKCPGDRIYVLGETGDHLGGSEYYRYLGERDGLRPELGQPAPYLGGKPPVVDTEQCLPLYRALEAAVRSGWVRSAAVPAKGGLAGAIARSALAGGLGARLDLDACPVTGDLAFDTVLFSESNGRFLVSVHESDTAAFEASFAGLPCRQIGNVTERPTVTVGHGSREPIEVSLADLRKRFSQGLAYA